MKRKTQIEIIREKHQKIQEGICKLLEVTSVEYLDFMMDRGFDYLRHDLKLDEWMVEQLSGNKIYWSWWRQQWFHIDSIFLKRFPAIQRSVSDYSNVKNYYFKDFHTTANIQCHLEVMKQTYDDMLRKVIKDVESINAKHYEQHRRGTRARSEDIKTERVTNKHQKKRTKA